MLAAGVRSTSVGSSGHSGGGLHAELHVRSLLRSACPCGECGSIETQKYGKPRRVHKQNRTWLRCLSALARRGKSSTF